MLLEKFRSFLRRRPKDRKGPKLHVEVPSQPTQRPDGDLGQGPGLSALSGWSQAGGNPRGIPDSSPQNVTAGFFAGAHDMIVQNSTMVSQTIQNFGTNDTVLRILEGAAVSGAELDSSDRHPPRCHNRTRLRLRRDIIYWFIDPSRAHYLLWILGPVGVGKSAIAQTIGEYCKSKRTLGAAFFFSKLEHRDNPLKVIPSIAYQLAVRHPTYHRLVTRLLAKDSKIPFKDLRSQFRELIVKPFEALNRQGAFNSQPPLVIIIDGLDECRGDDAQCQLILLINECAQAVHNLLWIVCSRPEWHLRDILSRPDSGIRCWCEELSVDDEDARMDVNMFLKDGFREIQQRFSGVLDPRWPSRADIKEISTRASGLFVFASTILTYVGDKAYGTPDANLHACLRFIRETPISAAANPFRALDFLYYQIISKVPSHFFPTAMRILSLHILYDTGFTFWETCVFLGIDRSSFYSSFMPLPAVLHVPDQYHATETRLMFYHSSFSEFLRSPNRSYEFSLNEFKARIDITTHLLRWYNFFINKNCKLKGQQPCTVHQPHISWVPSHGRNPSLEKIRDFCHYNCWSSFQYLNSGAVPHLMAEIEHFRFCHLRWLDRTFTIFVRWYHSNDPAAKFLAQNLGVRFFAKMVRGERKVPLVRNWITNGVDRVLVDKYGGSRLSWAENIPQEASNIREITSLHFDTDRDPPKCQVFLLGQGEFACLVEMWL